MQNILQWNCRGIRTSALDLQACVRQTRPLAICLQETKLSPESYFSMKGYSIFRKDLTVNTISHGGVLLAVHHSVPVKQVPLVTSLQAVAARLCFIHREVTVCSIYCPPGVALPLVELHQLIAELPPPVLILGDFNSHHSAWGCDSTCPRGRRLASFLNDESLCLLNTGAPTHFTLPSGGTSALDLSLASPQLSPLFTWRADHDPMGSDHFPVWIEFREQMPLGRRPPRWNLAKADWSQFQSRLEETFQGISVESLSVETFTSRLIEVAQECIPRTSGAQRCAPVPWWSDSCLKAKRARKRALRAFDRNATTTNMIAYKKAKAAARRTFNEAKRASWRAYVSQLTRFTPISEVWSRIKRISGRSCSVPLPVLRIHGQDVMHPADVANEIGRALSEKSRGDCLDGPFVRHRAQCERAGVNFTTPERLPYNDPFTMTELRSSITGLRPVAEGPDTIHNEMLRHLPSSILDILLTLFNSLWERGIYPDAWRDAIIIPLLKAGKSGLEPLHYRPIALTSSLGKLMERMVNSRLSWWFEKHDIFSNAQCGFRRHRSTVDHILALDTEIRASFKQRRHVGAVFFDIEAAYDTTWRLGILRKLLHYGVRGTMGLFLQNFLSDRFFRVRVGNELSERFPQINGVPQGGVLSVVLFAIMINDIGEYLSPAIGRALFVDDLSIWLSASSTRSVERQLQVAVAQLERWSAANGLKFSTAKTVAMHFCRRRRPCPDMSVRLYGELIPVQPEVKFLGVLLDSRLTYRPHIKKLRDKCMRALNILKCVARTTYGSDRSTLLLLYRSLVRSKLDYACFIYDNTYESIKSVLDTVHHAAIRVATGAFRTTPISSLLAEAHEPPLALRRQLLGMRYAVKLRQFPSHPTYPSVFSRTIQSAFENRAGQRRRRFDPFCVRVLDLIAGTGLNMRDVMRIRCSPSPPWRMVMPEIDTSLAEMRKGQVAPVLFKARALEHVSAYANYTVAYTDGSKTGNGVGCAFVLGQCVRSFSLPKHASVFTSEVVAIMKLLSYIETEDDILYLILTDSLSCLMALRSSDSQNPFVQEVLQRITSLKRVGKQITLCWIPSHVGITGNEAADAAARRAAEKPCTRRFPLHARDFYPTIASSLSSRWQETWDQNHGNKLYAIKPKLSLWDSSSRKSRREEVTLCRLRTGHTYATHGYLLCGDARPQCPRCGSSLTVKHVIVDCPQLDVERRRCFGMASSELSLTRVLGNDSSRTYVEGLFKFLAVARLSVIYSPL